MKGMQPLEESGKIVKELCYELKKLEEGEDGEGNVLTCNDVGMLADAIEYNKVFFGELDLKKQVLTDISAMHIGRILRSGQHLSKLDISQRHTCKFTHKAGEYIGQGILDNPECGLTKVEFEGIYLGESGLQRIIEACNDCKTIEKLDVGIITDTGLKLLAKHLKTNEGLEEIYFHETEDHQKYWSKEAMQDFADLLKSCTKLKKVRAKF